MEEFLLFVLSNQTLDAVIELIGRVGPIDLELWDTLIGEVERRLRGGAAEAITLPSHVFDRLPEMVQDLFRRSG